MKYIIYLSAFLIVLSSCKSTGFTKQRYTHYNVSHKKENNRTLARVISENKNAPVASAQREIVTVQPVEATAPEAVKTEKSEMPVVSGGAAKRQQDPASSFAKSREGNGVLNLASYTPKVKDHFQQTEKNSHGPISFLLRVVLSILLIIILVFLIILLIALL